MLKLLQGYKTVAVAVVMSLAATGAIQYSTMPPGTEHVLTVLADLWGLLMIVARMFTSTPVGQKATNDVAQALGLSPSQMDMLLARLPQKADIGDLVAKVERLSADFQVAKQALVAVPAATAAPTPGAALVKP